MPPLMAIEVGTLTPGSFIQLESSLLLFEGILDAQTPLLKLELAFSNVNSLEYIVSYLLVDFLGYNRRYWPM